MAQSVNPLLARHNKNVAIKNPLPAAKNGKLADAEPLPDQNNGNPEKGNSFPVAKDDNFDHSYPPVAKSDNRGQVQPQGTTELVEPQGKTELVQPSVKTRNEMLLELQNEDTANADVLSDENNIPGQINDEHYINEALNELNKRLLSLRLEDGSYINWEDKQTELNRIETLFESLVEALQNIANICNKKKPESFQIMIRYGTIQGSIQAYYALKTYRLAWSSLALKVLIGCLKEKEGKDVFLKANGPQVVLEALAMENEEPFNHMIRELSCLAANALALAALDSDTVRERFMDLGADEVLVAYLKFHAEEMGADGAALQAACDAIQSLTMADDDQAPGSNGYINATKLAKVGIIDAFLVIIPQRCKILPLLPSLCLTLKSLVVNDDICTSFAREGGLVLMLDFLEYACNDLNIIVGRNLCALLSQLARSDTNKAAIVKNDGIKRIIQLMETYKEEPSVLLEGFAAITILTLNPPQHVTQAVQAGALDIAAELMEAHPNAPEMLCHACQMVGNLNVQNPENRSISLKKGLGPLLKKAKDTHEICKDVGLVAFNELGLQDEEESQPFIF